MSDFIVWTVKLYPNIIYSCFIYLFILFLKIIGVYGEGSLSSSNAILMIAYMSILHVAGVPCLIYAMRHSTQFYMGFLVCNGFWLLLVVIYILYISMGSSPTEGWSNNPLHHMLLMWYFITALALEILVYLHRNTIITFYESSSATVVNPEV